jgi:hypothetical protein
MLAGIALLLNANRAHAAVIEPNLALNPSQTGYPQVSASHTLSADNVWSVVNGIKSYNDSPRDRWTNYPSTASDSITVNFGSPTTFNRIKLFVFNDGGGVTPPSSYLIQYYTGADWTDIPNQVKTPAVPQAAENTVDFEPIRTSQFRILFTSGGKSVGLVELEVYFHYTNEDELAAAPVIAAIAALPETKDIAMSDEPAVNAARNAYNALSGVQKTLVTNSGKLLNAENAIAALTPVIVDIPLLSAFSNAAGNTVQITMSSVIDQTYALSPNPFHISINGLPATVVNAVYNMAEPDDRTITLNFGTSTLITSSTPVTVSIDSGAFRVVEGSYNTAIPPTPVITFQKLNQNGDPIFNVEDIVPIAANTSKHIDVNRDGEFDEEDVAMLLRQIVVPL